MATIDELYGPDVSLNLDELESSRTQAATTASQTIRIASNLLSQHNDNPDSHPNIVSLIPGYANADTAGTVLIDPDLLQASVLDYAVPNSQAVIKYIDAVTEQTVVYAGYVEIGNIDVENKTIPIDSSVNRGYYYVLTGDGSIDYDGHTFTNGDYIIAKQKINKTAAKTFDKFDWYNIQDRDVVKTNLNQTLTNKDISSDSNTYRDASTLISGAVIITNDVTLSGVENAVVNVSYLKTLLDKKLNFQYTGKIVSNLKEYTTSGEIYKAEKLSGLTTIIKSNGFTVTVPEVVKNETVAFLSDVESETQKVQSEVAEQLDIFRSTANEGHVQSVNLETPENGNVSLDSLIAGESGEVYKKVQTQFNFVNDVNKSSVAFRSAAHFGSTYYFGGNGTGVYWSDDGKNLTSSGNTLLASEIITGFAEKSGYVYSVSNSGKIFRDLVDSDYYNAVPVFENSGIRFNGIFERNGKLIAFGEKGNVPQSESSTIFVSTDGETWSPIIDINETTANGTVRYVSTDIGAVGFYNNHFYFFGSNRNLIGDVNLGQLKSLPTSTTSGTPTSSIEIKEIIYVSHQNGVSYSTDYGQTWNQSDLTSSISDLNYICGRFYATSDDGEGIFTSFNGIAWKSVSEKNDGSFSKVLTFNNVVYLLGFNGTLGIYRSAINFSELALMTRNEYQEDISHTINVYENPTLTLVSGGYVLWKINLGKVNVAIPPLVQIWRNSDNANILAGITFTDNGDERTVTIRMNSTSSVNSGSFRAIVYNR